MRPSLVTRALARGDAQPLINLHRQLFGTIVMMADGDDDADDGDDSNDGDDDASGDDDGPDTDKDKRDPRVKELSDENKRRRLEAKAQKKQIDDLMAKVKGFEDADKGDLEKAKGTLDEVTKDRDGLKTKNAELVIQNAFLLDNKHEWANPRAALRLADLSEVEIDDDGAVTGLAEALNALAKSDPYLLKSKSDDKDDEDKDDSKGAPGATGQPPGKKTKGNPDREKLLAKYPALNRY